MKRREKNREVKQLAYQKHGIGLEVLLQNSDAFEVGHVVAQAHLNQQLEVSGGWEKVAAEFSINMHVKGREIFVQGTDHLSPAGGRVGTEG